MGKEKVNGRWRWCPQSLPTSVLKTPLGENLLGPVSKTGEISQSFDQCDLEETPHQVSLPAELVIDILEMLSFEYLIVKARLLNRIWYTLAMYRARLLVRGWLQKVQKVLSGDVEMVYHGTRSRIHKAESLVHPYRDYLGEKCTPSFSENTALINIQFSKQDNVAEEPGITSSTAKVRSVQVGLLGNFLDFPDYSDIQGKGTKTTIWFRFGSHLPMKCKLLPPKEFRVSDKVQGVRVMDLGGIWMEVKQGNETQRVNLTTVLSDQFKFHFTFTGNFRTRDSWYYTKRCYFLGYDATLKISSKSSHILS
jgi:hypothetical protein